MKHALRHSLTDYFLFGNLFCRGLCCCVKHWSCFPVAGTFEQSCFYADSFQRSSPIIPCLISMRKCLCRPAQQRSVWYATHRKTVLYSQVIFTMLAIAGGIYLVGILLWVCTIIPWSQWLIALLFPGSCLFIMIYRYCVYSVWTCAVPAGWNQHYWFCMGRCGHHLSYTLEKWVWHFISFCHHDGLAHR